jgi:hypothetical protein
MQRSTYNRVGLYVSIYGSDSQLRYRKEVSGVPQNLELLPLLIFYHMKCRQIVIFNHLRVSIIFFKELKGAANQKRLKTLIYGNKS